MSCQKVASKTSIPAREQHWMLEDCSTKCSETPDVKSFPVDVSILTLAMDANPVNEVVKLLPDFETKIQEARRPNNFTRVSVFGVS